MKEVQSLGDIRFGTLARAAEGLTQWRPLLLAFLTLLLTGLVISLGQLLPGILALVMMLVAFVVLMGGFSGVGIMLMDKAKEQPVRSFAAAASAGLLCLPKFLLIGLAMMAAFIVYMLLAAVIYFIGKIPFIGGIIAFIAHPFLVLVFAAALVALIWVIGPLMAPALWSGMPVKAAMGNVIAIARKRLIEVVLMEVVLYIILSLIGVMLFAGLVPASLSLTAMGTSIMGDSNAMMAMAAGMGGRGVSPLSMLYAGGNTWGLTAGLGVLYCVVGALMTQVGIMGMNLIYLQARGNLDHSEAEDVLDDFMGDVRKKATEAKERARQAAQDLSAKKAADDSAATPAAAASASYNSAEAHPPTASYGTAAAAAAGMTAGSVSAAAPPMDAAHGESMAREQAMAAERARVAAETEAARLRAAAEAEAAAQARAEEQAAAQRAAEQQAQAQAAAQAAEQARQREQAEAAERAEVQAAEQARLREQAEAEARAQEQARLQAEQEAAEREAARLKAQAEAEEKARQTAASPNCPNCHAHVSADDMFCGECGYKLK
ncbi:MAG: zinc ribbon domain-containing protein [Comamonas sp.]|jgi:hypothetical protein|uniref:zinc ribbon domain-containing protein n=1 Tax=Comamonas sp. TaxID=34028 RepID=UPI0028364D39|nr:zinc ribbon domain-containing protein [Comamonas sp.]MDR0215240.1 zinc ribbon domain-containing protein [Comamonas sp.]